MQTHIIWIKQSNLLVVKCPSGQTHALPWGFAATFCKCRVDEPIACSCMTRRRTTGMLYLQSAESTVLKEPPLSTILISIHLACCSKADVSFLLGIPFPDVTQRHSLENTSLYNKPYTNILMETNPNEWCVASHTYTTSTASPPKPYRWCAVSVGNCHQLSSVAVNPEPTTRWRISSHCITAEHALLWMRMRSCDIHRLPCLIYSETWHNWFRLSSPEPGVNFFYLALNRDCKYDFLKHIFCIIISVCSYFFTALFVLLQLPVWVIRLKLMAL